MSDAVLVALIFLCGTMVTPFIAARIGRAERQAIAEEVKGAANALVASNAEVAATAEVAARDRVSLSKQVREVHTLVNSQLTERIRSELDETVARLATLRELVDLKRANGIEPTDDTLAVIEATESKVALLEESLADREQAQSQAAAEAGA